MDPNPEELSRYMNTHYPGGTYHSVYEAGFCGYWIHRELCRLGFKNIITNPADVPTTNKEKDRKSDPIDSGKLSRELEHHSLSAVYVPTPEQEALRSLSRLWHQYARRGSQVKNRIKGFLLFTGVAIPQEYEHAYWSHNYVRMLSSLKFDVEIHRYVLDRHIEELMSIRTKRLALLRKIRELSKDITTIGYLQTVPGIGQIVSFMLYAELIEMRRFHRIDELLSYIGLVPSTRSSDRTEYVRGITQRQSKHLRCALIESAWVAVREDPALTMAYNELTKRMSKGRAIIRIAKKLVNRIRYVWLHQKPYVIGVVG